MSNAASEAAAAVAVQAYIDGFNSRDPEQFSQTLHYPHMRVDGLGRVRTWQRWQDHAAEVDFARALASGWDHSVLDWQKVVQSGQHKVHVAVAFTRYNAAGEAYLTQQSLYVVTRQDRKWAISVRSSFLEESTLGGQ